MTAQKSKDLLVKIGDGATSESFTTIAGGTAHSITLNDELVDVTNKDSTDRWREVLEGAGVRTCSISGSGVFKDSASEASLRTAFAAETHSNFQLIVPDFYTFTGAFKITQLQYAGQDPQGHVTYDFTLESAGVITMASV